jgi:23S rRNA (cytosine1962-C5)-methyltransferase
MTEVRLKIARRSSHPWIFQRMVEKPATRIPPGSVVDVLDRDGQWAGRGFYNGHSRITLRILTTNRDEAIDESFFARQLDRAISLRRDMLRLDEVSDAYRLVHSEADGLSGLVVDRFADVIVLEFFSAGMFRQRELIRDLLAQRFPDCRFYWFAEEHVQKQESFDVRPLDPPAPALIREHGLKFRVAPGGKHKTGFFADQRENRRALSDFCHGKRVLDLCCNSGGFSVYAKAMGKASEVVGVDLDEEALALAKQNAGLNQAQVRFVQADIFTWLRDILTSDTRFDVVILDPAKQTRDRDDIEWAIKRYIDMNKLAMQAVSPGGLLLTCSCTGLVSEKMFLDAVRRASFYGGRSLQVLRITGAAADHPFRLHVPEGRYLKAVWGRVE